MTQKYLGFGVGLRTKHKQQIINEKPTSIDWFEIISENYFDLESSGCKQLEKIRTDYPFVMHGVSLSIGSTDPLNMEYLKKLKALEQWLQPELVSDHICWTGIQKFNTHDLLPVPYTEEALQNMVDKVLQVQDFLGRKIALENPSTYLEFSDSYIPEWEFINELLVKADCNLLLDINNLYVNCFNHNYNPYTYINTLNADKVVQIHMAGHENYGTHIIDTHNSPIIPEVLDLYQYTIQKIGLRNSMIEWDADIPELPVLIQELEKLKKTANKTVFEKPSKIILDATSNVKTKQAPALNSLYKLMQESIYHPEHIKNIDWIKKGIKALPKEQLEVYVFGYRKRLMDAIRESYPITEKLLGLESFNKLITAITAHNPSIYYDINQYLIQVPKFSKDIVENIHYELMLLESEMLKLDIKSLEEGVTLKEFQQLSPEDLMTTNISTTSSVSVASFTNDIYTIYKNLINNKESLKLAESKEKQTYILMQKDLNGIANIPISKKEFYFLNSLNKQDDFVSALEECIEGFQISIEECMALLEQFINENTLKLAN
jgi:uncharacterized protein (UPF0276 family)